MCSQQSRDINVTTDVQIPSIKELVEQSTAIVDKITQEVDKRVKENETHLTRRFEAWQKATEIEINDKADKRVKDQVAKLTKAADDAEKKADAAAKEKIATRDKKIVELELKVKGRDEAIVNLENQLDDEVRVASLHDLYQLLGVLQTHEFFKGWSKGKQRQTLESARDLIGHLQTAIAKGEVEAI